MNNAELRAVLESEGIPGWSYDLDGGSPSEAYVLAEEAGTWSVYYSERGLRTGERTFPSEDAACRHLLESLRNEPSLRKR